MPPVSPALFIYPLLSLRRGREKPEGYRGEKPRYWMAAEETEKEYQVRRGERKRKRKT